MLEALRERLAAVAPADLLPLAAFDAGGDGEEAEDEEEEDGELGGVVVVEVEQQDLVDDDRHLLLPLADDDDGDDDNDAAEARARARGSDQACAGLSKRAGWPQDFSPGARAAAAAGAAAAGIALVRSPLAALVLAGNGPASRGRSLGHVAALLHSGFPLDMSPSPAVSVRIEAPPVLLPALAALARLGPGERTSVQGVAGAVGLALEGEQALLLWKLVGVLVYHGYLRPDE